MYIQTHGTDKAGKIMYLTQLQRRKQYTIY